MAATESIVKLKVENSEYDAKIKRAAQGLLHMEDAAKASGRSLTTLTKEEKEYISSLGKMETVSKTARGRVNELTTAFVNLSSQYNRLTDEQKKGEYGVLLSKQLEQVRQRAVEARSELESINRNLAKVESSSTGLKSIGLDFKQLASNAIGFTGALGAATLAINTIKGVISDNIETARNFEQAMANLSSLTGLTGDKLDYLKEKAIELGGSTTQSASQVAESFMLIGSKMPELLGSADALSDVTKAAITLAEASGGTVTDSANALTAALNIMGEGASQANRYINVLAAGSQKGTRSITELTDIVFRAGQSAHSCGISFEELIAIAAAGTKEFDSAESAGQGMSKLFVQLEKQSNDQLKPSVVGVTEAIKNLTEANYSQVDAIKLFTVNGAKAYRSIIDNKDAILETLPAITNTNTATEQAATNTNTLNGAMNRLKSAWEETNLRINDSNGLLKEAVDGLASVLSYCNHSETVSKFWDEWKLGILRTLVPLGQLHAFVFQLAGIAGNSNYNQTQGGRRTVYKGKGGKIYNTEAEARASYGSSTPKSSNSTGGGTTYDDTTLKGIAAHIKALKEQRLAVQQDSQEWANLTAEITRLQSLTRVGGKGGKGGKTDTPIKDKLVFKTKFLTQDEESKLLMDVLKKNESGEAAIDLQLKQGQSQLGALQDAFGFGDLNSGEKIWTEWDFYLEECRKKAEALSKAGEDVHKTWQQAASAIGGIGSVLQQLPNPAAKVFGIIAEAIANVAGGFASALASSETGKLSVWEWIAEAAAGAATMVSTISAIKSATSGNYANGGIIPGNSYSGDNLRMYGVNSGELVLNQAQTSNLATKLNNNAEQRINAQPYLDCEKIYLGLNTFLGATGRGELITTRG